MREQSLFFQTIDIEFFAILDNRYFAILKILAILLIAISIDVGNTSSGLPISLFCFNQKIYVLYESLLFLAKSIESDTCIGN